MESAEKIKIIALGRKMLDEFIQKELGGVGSSNFLEGGKIMPGFSMDDLTDEDFIIAYKVFTESITEEEYRAYDKKVVDELEEQGVNSNKSSKTLLEAVRNFVGPIFYERSKKEQGL